MIEPVANGGAIQVIVVAILLLERRDATMVARIRAKGIEMAINIGHDRGNDIASHPELTARRLEKLERYLATNVLDPETKDFRCRFAAQCKASHDGKFYEGQLHHLGEHYDLTVGGRDLRVVVVGQEYGHNPIHVTMAERRLGIVEDSGLGHRFFSTPKYMNRNPHMRGTTSLLRLLFGLPLGSDFEGEFLRIAGQYVHIFNAFALVNFLLCSAVSADADEPTEIVHRQLHGARSGMATRVMLDNCATHFRKCLEVLEPTVIIAQGRGVRNWMGRRLGLRMPPPGTIENPAIERIRISGSETLLIAFSHPSAHAPHSWGMNEGQDYTLNTVKPKIHEIRSLLRLERLTSLDAKPSTQQ
jgi:hypothetical protein